MSALTSLSAFSWYSLIFSFLLSVSVFKVDYAVVFVKSIENQASVVFKGGWDSMRILTVDYNRLLSLFDFVYKLFVSGARQNLVL